ncbi:hypothetical protein L798_03202 [Zootermopsis nevadensis]|uniref:Uncharacterized protein n=1 Tax=Zootermopsis nevadensis TaxID=136037 RepID=A0A067RQ41_ZOONE|nr:hypothetical protein L798_03202 [Zootermopsis nevadensis]
MTIMDQSEPNKWITCKTLPMVWWEPATHFTDSYRKGCSPIRKGVTMNTKWTVTYPNIPSAIRPVPHCELLPIPERPESLFCRL